MSHNKINKNMTFTGNKALMADEPLIFEIGRYETTGVDFEEYPEVKDSNHFLGNFINHNKINLPGLTEPEVMRHYTKISRNNYSIDSGIFPLGSCTMKHNPRLNEKMARLSGLMDIHPLQPISTTQGILELMDELAKSLLAITGMDSVSLTPKAGAHGELTSIMTIKKAITQRKEHNSRNVILIPDSAHGTNPATAATLGFITKTIPSGKRGIIEYEDIKHHINENVAAIMLTNPNTCGFFEENIIKISQAIHQAGGYLYCDGANLNAILGKVYPGQLGIDAMHINLHKTFSTPHGGGGPGAGPVVFSKRLTPFIPIPLVKKISDQEFTLVESKDNNIGRISAFHGQVGMFIRALSYILSNGHDGLRQSSEDAVLAANYIRANLEDLFCVPFTNNLTMHEVIFSDKNFSKLGVTTLDIAKALIDEGYHPMTIYFPIIVQGAMLIEPTESESKASLDLFIATLRDIAIRINDGKKEELLSSPRFAPRKRLDETQAARNPILKW